MQARKGHLQKGQQVEICGYDPMYNGQQGYVLDRDGSYYMVQLENGQILYDLYLCELKVVECNQKKRIIKAMCKVLDNYIERRDASHKYKSVLEKMKGLIRKDPNVFRYYGHK